MKFIYDSLSHISVLLLQCSFFVIYARVLSDGTPFPRFLPTPTNLTVNAGSVAEIKCKIQNLGGRTVVWRRASEPNPLSVGTTPYTEKHRVRVTHRGQMWTIYIGSVQPRDSGVYECQISSKENLRKLFMLRVNGTGTGLGLYPKDVPDPSIRDKLSKTIHVRGTEVVEVGQPIRLECNTTRVGDSPQALDWFIRGDKITPNFNKKITIKTEELRGSRVFTSKLQIEHSQKSDTGMYLCRNSDQEVSRIYVDVLNTYSSNVKRGDNPDPSTRDKSSKTYDTNVNIGGSMPSEGDTGAGSRPQCCILQTWKLVTLSLCMLFMLGCVN